MADYDAGARNAGRFSEILLGSHEERMWMPRKTAPDERA
jgi:hypothetical protein